MGILTCLSVVASRLAEATALVDAGFLTQAAVVFSFAVEEFGKAALLRAAYDGGHDPVTVDGFYDHQAKLVAAAEWISTEHLLLTEAVFHPDDFDDSFDIGTQADWAARLAGLYVDWKEGKWRYGVKVEPDALRKSLDGVQAALTAAVVNWT